MFKKLKEIEFEKKNEDGSISYFVRPDGTQASILQRMNLIVIGVIGGLLYIAFRMLTGTLAIALFLAILTRVVIPNDVSLFSLTLVFIKHPMVIFFGSIFGAGFWISEL